MIFSLLPLFLTPANFQEPAPAGEVQIGEFRFQSFVSRQEGDEIVYVVSDLRFRSESTRLTGDYAVLWLDAARYAKLFEREGEGLHRPALLPPSRGRILPTPPTSLLATGPAATGKEEYSLPADLVREMYIEGTVFFEQGEERLIQGTSLYMDLNSGRALIAEGRLTTSGAGFHGQPIPLSVKADWFRREATGRFVADNAQYTTCSFGKPHQHIRSDQLWIEETEAGSAVDAYRSTFKLEDTGIFYLPRTVLDPEIKDMLLFRGMQFGTTSSYGFFIYSKWGQRFRTIGEDFNEWLFGERLPFRGNWELRLDRRRKRGNAFGPEIEWETPGHYKGRLRSYFARDFGNDSTFYAGQIDRQEKHRSRVLFENRIWFDKEWTFDTEIAYLSDPSFLPEFFRRDYFKDKEPETAAYLRWARDNQAFSALVTGAINDFDPIPAIGFLPPQGTTVFDPPRLKEALPELQHRWFREPVFSLPLPAGTGEFSALELPVYYTERSSVSYLRSHPSKGIEFEPGTISFLPAESLASVRFDTAHEISAPFHAQPLVLTPFLEERYTVYSADANGDELGRLVGSAGLRITTHVEGSIGENWIHGIDPSVSYVNTYTVTRSPSDLIAFDETEDVVKTEQIILGLRNRFARTEDPTQKNKTRSKESARWNYPFDLDFRLPIFLNPDRDNSGHRYGDLETDIYIETSIQSGPLRYLRCIAELGSVVRGPGLTLHRLNFAEIQVDTQPTDQLGLFVAHRRLRTDAGQSLNLSLVGGFNYKVSDKWRLVGFENYDFETHKPHSHGFSLQRLGHDWIVEISASFNDVTDERIIAFNFQPLQLFQRGRQFRALSNLLNSSVYGQQFYTGD